MGESKKVSTLHIGSLKCNHLILGAPTEVNGQMFSAGEYRAVDGNWVKVEEHG